jgi:hypothetical protein
MKKLTLLLIFIFTLCLGAAGTAHALDYAPLEPLPGLESAQNINFAQFVGAIFRLLIIAGALLAVGTLVYAGISYILSEAFETKGEARKRMIAAFYGLAILLGAWLMLYTINPTLLNFDLSSIGGTGNTPSSSTGTQKTDVNITAQVVRIWCLGSLPAHDVMMDFKDICSAQGKQVAAGQRVPSRETSTSGECYEYVCK